MHLPKFAVAGMACFGLVATSPCSAAEGNDWQYEATLYLHAAAMEGDAGVKGVTADVDMPFSDIWDNLDAGFMGMFTARKGPWSFGLDVVYMDLGTKSSKSVTGPFGKVTVDGALDLGFTQTVAMASAGYRVLDDRTKLDVVAGLRYNRLETEAKVKIASSGIVFPGGKASADGTWDWYDGIVGLRVIQPVTEKVSLVGYADVGQGGSDFTYQLIAGANWEFAKDFTAKAGYRQIYWDYKHAGATWDMTAAGPYLGLGIKF